jgi:hypothetical protein
MSPSRSYFWSFSQSPPPLPPPRKTVDFKKWIKQKKVIMEIEIVRELHFRGHGIRPTDSADECIQGFASVKYFTRIALQDPWPVSSAIRHLSLTTVILPKWFRRWPEAKEQQLKRYVGWRGVGVSRHGSSFRNLTTAGDKPATFIYCIYNSRARSRFCSVYVRTLWKYRLEFRASCLN